MSYVYASLKFWCTFSWTNHRVLYSHRKNIPDTNLFRMLLCPPIFDAYTFWLSTCPHILFYVNSDIDIICHYSHELYLESISLLRFFFGEFCHAILFGNLKCCNSSWRHPRAISGLRIWYGASVSIIIASFRNNSPYLLLVSAYHIALIFTAFYSKQLLFYHPA